MNNLPVNKPPFSNVQTFC